MEIWLVLLLVALGIPALGVAGFVLAIRQRRVIAALQVEIGRLARRMEGLETAAAGPPPEAVPEVPEAEPEAVVQPEPEPEPAPAPAPTPVEVPIAAKVGLEERLASRWLVWLGAVALALAGLFLILYAVEHGWIGPTARVALGLLLGIALAAAGEWTRRRPWQMRFAMASNRPCAGRAGRRGAVRRLRQHLWRARALRTHRAACHLHRPCPGGGGGVCPCRAACAHRRRRRPARGLRHADAGGVRNAQCGGTVRISGAGGGGGAGRGALSRLGVAGRQRGDGRLPVDDPVAVRCLPAGRPVRGDGLSRFPRRDEPLAGERGDAAGRAGPVAVAPARAEPASVRVRRVPGRRVAGRLGDRRDRRDRRAGPGARRSDSCGLSLRPAQRALRRADGRRRRLAGGVAGRLAARRDDAARR
jgi:hypothetical protein